MSIDLQTTGATLTPPTRSPSNKWEKVRVVSATVSAVCLAFFVDTIYCQSQGVQYLQQMCYKAVDWTHVYVKPFVISGCQTAEEYARPAIAFCQELYSNVEFKAAEVYRWATGAPAPQAAPTSWRNYLWSV